MHTDDKVNSAAIYQAGYEDGYWNKQYLNASKFDCGRDYQDYCVGYLHGQIDGNESMKVIK